MSSSILGHQSSFHSKDSHGTGALWFEVHLLTFVLVYGIQPDDAKFLFSTVKLSIKSFHVPEVYIEMPDTATVGSLKVYIIQYFSSFL